jgi:hypothetical protein
MARSRPPRTWPIEAGIWSITQSIWPASKSFSARPLLLAETITPISLLI